MIFLIARSSPSTPFRNWTSNGMDTQSARGRTTTTKTRREARAKRAGCLGNSSGFQDFVENSRTVDVTFGCFPWRCFISAVICLDSQRFKWRKKTKITTTAIRPEEEEEKRTNPKSNQVDSISQTRVDRDTTLLTTTWAWSSSEDTDGYAESVIHETTTCVRYRSWMMRTCVEKMNSQHEDVCEEYEPTFSHVDNQTHHSLDLRSNSADWSVAIKEVWHSRNPKRWPSGVERRASTARTLEA